MNPCLDSRVEYSCLCFSKILVCGVCCACGVQGMSLANPSHTLVSTCIIPPQLATDCLSSSGDPLESMEDTSDEDVQGSNGRSEPHSSRGNGSSIEAQAAFVPCILMLTLHGYGECNIMGLFIGKPSSNFQSRFTASYQHLC